MDTLNMFYIIKIKFETDLETLQLSVKNIISISKIYIFFILSF